MTPVDNNNLNSITPPKLTEQEIIDQEILLGVGIVSNSSNQSTSTKGVDDDLYNTTDTTAVADTKDAPSLASTLTQEELDADFKHKRRHLLNISAKGKL